MNNYKGYFNSLCDTMYRCVFHLHRYARNEDLSIEEDASSCGFQHYMLCLDITWGGIQDSEPVRSLFIIIFYYLLLNFSYIYTCIHCLFIRLMFICNCSFVIVRFNAMQRNYLYYLYIEFFFFIVFFYCLRMKPESSSQRRDVM